MKQRARPPATSVMGKVVVAPPQVPLSARSWLTALSAMMSVSKRVFNQRKRRLSRIVSLPSNGNPIFLVASRNRFTLIRLMAKSISTQARDFALATFNWGGSAEEDCLNATDSYESLCACKHQRAAKPLDAFAAFDFAKSYFCARLAFSADRARRLFLTLTNRGSQRTT